jgi:hypothetical protein
MQVHLLNKLLGLLVLVLLVTGCKTKQITNSPKVQSSTSQWQPPIPPGGASPESANGMGAIPFADFKGFKFLKGKLKFEYEMNGSGHKATASLRMAEDSLIWLSITPGLGIEVMRVMFTTDSLKFVDKINKNYGHLSYDQLSQLTGVPINFKMVQAIMLGNTLPVGVNTIVPDSGSDKPLMYKLITLGNPTITQLLAPQLNRSKEVLIETQNPKFKASMWVQYANHQSVLNFSQLFPMKKNILIEQDFKGQREKSKITVDLEHQRTEQADSTLLFPYYVPNGYQNMVQEQLNAEE